MLPRVRIGRSFKLVSCDKFIGRPDATLVLARIGQFQFSENGMSRSGAGMILPDVCRHHPDDDSTKLLGIASPDHVEQAAQSEASSPRFDVRQIVFEAAI